MRKHIFEVIPIKLVIAILIGVLALLAIVFGVLKTARVYIMVAPESATIKINGKSYKNGKHVLFPGNKKVVISGEGIETYETEINTSIFSDNKVAVYLKKDGSYDSYINSRSDYRILKLLSSQEEDAQAQEFLKRVEKARKFIDLLPIDVNYPNESNKGYVENYFTNATNDKDCPAALCIRHIGGDIEKTDFIFRIKLNGYNPDDYYIISGNNNAKNK